MSKVISTPTISIDGYLAGPRQSRENGLGEGGEQLHRWMFEAEEENRAERDAVLGHGAYIMGRNMFGPIRGEWDDPGWHGWWGEEPPYHAPVFVLTHYPREPIAMKGGTTFHFVTDGIESALEQARAAAGERTVAVMGGASTIDQYLQARLIDELRLAIAPMVLGDGARLFASVTGLDLEPVSSRVAPLVTHVTYRVRR